MKVCTYKGWSIYTIRGYFLGYLTLSNEPNDDDFDEPDWKSNTLVELKRFIDGYKDMKQSNLCEELASITWAELKESARILDCPECVKRDYIYTYDDEGELLIVAKQLDGTIVYDPDTECMNNLTFEVMRRR